MSADTDHKVAPGVEHFADDCQFEPCTYCGCCAHGKTLRAGCKVDLAPRGMSCSNTYCGCEGLA